MKTEAERFLDKEAIRIDDILRHLDKLENFCAGDCYQCAVHQSLGMDCVFDKDRIARNRAFAKNRWTFIHDFRAAFLKDQKDEVVP